MSQKHNSPRYLLPLTKILNGNKLASQEKTSHDHKETSETITITMKIKEIKIGQEEASIMNKRKMRMTPIKMLIKTISKKFILI